MTIEMKKQWFDGEKVVTQNIPESDIYKLLALAQPEQEPVAHCKVRPLRNDESFPKVEIDWVNQPVPGPLYAAPPQRTWVGLTKQQQLDIFAQSIAKKRSEHEHYIAIEQALKERNQ